MMFNLSSHDLRITAPVSWDDEHAEKLMERINALVIDAVKCLASNLREIDPELGVYFN